MAEEIARHVDCGGMFVERYGSAKCNECGDWIDQHDVREIRWHL